MGQVATPTTTPFRESPVAVPAEPQSSRTPERKQSGEESFEKETLIIAVVVTFVAAVIIFTLILLVLPFIWRNWHSKRSQQDDHLQAGWQNTPYNNYVVHVL